MSLTHLSLTHALRPHVDAELAAADAAQQQNNPALAFEHLERAHVLGQSSTRLHVHVHWRMLLWGWHNRQPKECVGQLVRLLGAATKTMWGLVPKGNTGGTNVSPFKSLPIAPDLADILHRANISQRP